jgi:RNA polymerase sigma factor (sigma-70 family)
VVVRKRAATAAIDTDDIDGAWDTITSLYRAHARDLLRLAVLVSGNRSEAEELVHEAFIRYQRAPSRPRPGAEVAYLRRTVVNLAHNTHHRRGLARRHLTSVPEPSPSAETVFGGRERQQRVVDAVRALSYRQRVCVILHYWAELTDVEIGEALGISAGSVKTHLHRARRALSELLEDA